MTGSLPLEFGLGQATRVEVEVRWPSGLIDRIRENVPADQRLTIREAGKTAAYGEDR